MVKIQMLLFKINSQMNLKNKLKLKWKNPKMQKEKVNYNMMN